jgi:hypothetical protein
MNEVYLPDESIQTLAEKIAKLEPCPFAGRVTSDQVKIALGEFGDIWPESIRE